MDLANIVQQKVNGKQIEGCTSVERLVQMRTVSRYDLKNQLLQAIRNVAIAVCHPFVVHREDSAH